MIEPVAYLVSQEPLSSVRWLSDVKPIGVDDKQITPLYTAEQLHPRVKMTQAEFDEFKKLLSVGISTIYEAFDVIDSDRGEMDEFEQLYNRLFTNGVNAQAQSQIEFSKLWDSLSTSSPEETIEIVPDMKWFVRSNEPEGEDEDEDECYLFLSGSNLDNLDYLEFDYAKSFNTKEEAELWTNPLTEAVQLPVDGE